MQEESLDTATGLHQTGRSEILGAAGCQDLAEKDAGANGDEIPYTAFNKTMRARIAVLASLAGFFSPLSANIYFPALPSIAKDLHVTIQLLNQTVTAYLVVQGLVPSITGDLADMVGRRPVYFLVLTTYLAANIGLACQDSYAALLVLRAVQSAGVSGCIALAVSVMADIAPPHVRGKYVGFALAGPNSAASLGPIVGGALTGTVGWRWVFWLLTILSASCLFLVAAFLPETCRNIVGNGSIPATGLNRSTFGRNGGLDHPAPDGGSAIVKPNLMFPNPFPCLRIVFHKDTGLVLVSNAIFYTIYSCVQASLSTLFAKIYHLNPIQVGLCYLAYGIGCAIASYGTGKIIDRDYQKTASAIGHSINKIAGDDLTKFPIERARLRSIFWFITIAVACTLGYGWTLHARTHISAPLILQFCCGLTVTGTFNVCNTLIVDLHPANPSTASAAVSMVRCLAAAVGVSVLQLMLDHLGVGWTFTSFAALGACTIPMLLLVKRWGMAWRTAREEKAGARMRDKNLS